MSKIQDKVIPVSLVAILRADFERSCPLHDCLMKLLTGQDGKMLKEVHVYGIGESCNSLGNKILIGCKVHVERHPSIADGVIIYEQEKHYTQL
jgi:hypothetical protein